MSKGEKATIAIGILGLIGIALQIWIAVTHEKEHRTDIVSTLFTIGFWLVLAAVNVFAIYKNFDAANKVKKWMALFDKINAIRDIALQDTKVAGVQAGMLWILSAQASDLVRQLEQLWHHFNAAGETLTHPVSVAVKLQMKKWDNGLPMERRDFMTLYQDHVLRMKAEFPKLPTEIVKCGYPSDEEYHVVFANLKEHQHYLENTAKQVWESGKEIDLK